MNRKITIVGAGLVGSLWAILLRQKKYEVTVFEKRSDIRKTTNDVGRSINLILTSRGLHALKQAGLLQEALDLSAPVHGRMIHSKKSELAYQPYGQDNERNFSISRRKLNEFLLNAAEKAGAKIYFEHSLEAVNFKEKKMSFNHQGKIVENNYDTLFGTDGAGSVVRKCLVQEFPNKFKDSIEWLPADYKELFLPAGSKLDHKALHIWPRGSHMMMALANLDGSFTVTLYLPKIGSNSFEHYKTPTEIQKLFTQEFPDAISVMPEYINDFQKNPHSSLGTVRCTKWSYEDSVALMGDAAHAIVPFFGQGANCGFEDCTYLMKILDETKDWTLALNKYDEIQRPNANAIADMAIENWFEMSERVADPKFLLRKKIESQLENKFPDLFKSRYGMVTYTLIPYHLVQKMGRVQDEYFSSLCSKLNSLDDFSIDQSEDWLKQQYAPLLKESQIELKRYTV